MKKLFAAALLIALVSMAAFAQDGNKRKGRQTANPSATPRVKKPVNNSTDSVADYNKPNNRQTNSAQRQNKAAERQANQQEKQAQRQAQQQERQAQREQKQKERAEQRQNGQNNRRGQNNGQNENLQDVIISSKNGGRANNNAQSQNSANAPTPPCNQLSGGDWLVKGKKCLDANGNVTTVGAYQRSQGNNNGTAKTPNATGNRRANRQNQNANGQLWDTAGQEDAAPKGQAKGNRGGRLNRNNPPANPEDPNATTGDGQRRPPSAQNGRLPNVPGATVESTDSTSPSGPPTNIPGARVSDGQQRPPSNNPPQNAAPKPNAPSNNNTPGEQAQMTPTDTNQSDLAKFGFIYPERPEEIVTWNPNEGPYGTTRTKPNWEFILTSNNGIAIRRAGREGTVVAHTKCNDPENYEPGYGGNGGNISLINCRPKREGLPVLRRSIMIVPRDQYFNDQR